MHKKTIILLFFLLVLASAWVVFLFGWTTDGFSDAEEKFHCNWFCPELVSGKIQVHEKPKLIEWCIKECSDSKFFFLEDSHLGANSSLPVILAWTSFFGDRMMEMSTINGTLPGCPYQCVYTDDRKFASYASSIIFHVPDLNPFSLPQRNIDVLNVFFIEESPAWRLKWWIFSYKFLPRNYFNLTMTYRKYSNIFAPYGAFFPIENTTKRSEIWSQSDVYVAALQKSSPVLFLVSNCDTHSKRELYVRELSKYINVTQLGGCTNKACDSSCEDAQIKKHFFYLAFENSVCQDYITEKFWRLKKLIVPIVLDRTIMENTIPSNVFIAASDFRHPAKLAEYLKHLMMDREEYIKYFDWTKKYRKSIKGPPKDDRLCKLCEITHNNIRNEIIDIDKWWTYGSNCQEDYANNLLARD